NSHPVKAILRISLLLGSPDLKGVEVRFCEVADSVVERLNRLRLCGGSELEEGTSRFFVSVILDSIKAFKSFLRFMELFIDSYIVHITIQSSTSLHSGFVSSLKNSSRKFQTFDSQSHIC